MKNDKIESDDISFGELIDRAKFLQRKADLEEELKWLESWTGKIAISFMEERIAQIKKEMKKK